MAPSAGQKLGPYEIVQAIGLGGMGEVYRARDSRLNRDVAIKVLPEHLIRDAEALAQFAREAKRWRRCRTPIFWCFTMLVRRKAWLTSDRTAGT
jgi:serine/threonine protein kinase